MFERKKYKAFAKEQLKNRWLIPVLITLFIAVIETILQSTINNEYLNINLWKEFFNGNYEVFGSESQSGLSFVFSIISFLVGAIFSYASIRVYLKMSRSPEPITFGDFFEGFNGWGKAILLNLWQLLWVCLWSLLFIIPGIIKAIAYSQMVYIMNEYENVSASKAMKISMTITKGYKGELFVMSLSFLGWILLSILTLGILNLWITPYTEMSFTNAYHAMMKDALETGKIKIEDLN